MGAPTTTASSSSSEQQEPGVDPWEGRMHGFDWQLERAR